jgi:hypothetical protein
MLHLLGYIGSSLNLIGMSMKNVVVLRIFSMIANAIYVVYGFQLDSLPIILSCTAVTIIHFYYLSKAIKRKNEKVSG